MSSNEQSLVTQPFWYSVQCDGATARFGYVDQQGTPIASWAGFEFVNGRWEEMYPGDSTMKVAPFGEAGCKITMTFSSALVYVGYQELNLVFDTVVDFTKPLPLDQLSIKDSSYSEVVEAAVPPETSTYAVQSLTPTTAPGAAAAEDATPVQS